MNAARFYENKLLRKSGNKVKPKKLLVMAVTAAVLSGCDETDAARANREAREIAEAAKQTALNNTRLDFTWHKGGFDSVLMADFKVRNENNFSIKDFTITCQSSAPSGTRIDNNTRVVYDVVKARSTKRLKDFNMGFLHSQAAHTACKVTSVELDW